MAGGRGSAVVGSAVLLCLLVAVHMANAAKYTVGDSKGWSFGVSDWTNGKSFAAGDVLVFKYNPDFHNVAIVSEAEYNTCIPANDDSKLFITGKDKITLAKGSTFFICGVPGHCEKGMRIAVVAA